MKFRILNEDLNDLIRDITALGSLFFYSFFMLLFLVLDQWQIFVKLFIALVLCYIINIPIRLLFFKKRPQEQKYSNVLEKITAGSFPSLHSMRSILLVIFISQFFENILLTFIFAIIFLLIITTRLLLKKHYITDLFGGVIIGIIIWYLTEVITQSL